MLQPFPSRCWLPMTCKKFKIFNFFSELWNLNFQYLDSTWKCMQMSTSTPSIGSAVLKTSWIWENVTKIQLCALILQPASKAVRVLHRTLHNLHSHVLGIWGVWDFPGMEIKGKLNSWHMVWRMLLSNKMQHNKMGNSIYLPFFSFFFFFFFRVCEPRYWVGDSHIHRYTGYAALMGLFSQEISHKHGSQFL